MNDTAAPRYPRISASEVPWVTLDQMVEADRLAIEEFGITLLQMMEHAGSAVAEVSHTLGPAGSVRTISRSRSIRLRAVASKPS